MNVLVFGAGGQVGSALLQALWPADTKITGLTHAQADIGDAASVARAFDSQSWDLVINAAAYVRVDDAERQRVEKDDAAALKPRLHWSCVWGPQKQRREEVPHERPQRPLGCRAKPRSAPAS